jgi:flavin reductase (DIM6/NTAB) family NADH-FMN oxidoreductase RutF
MLDSPSMAAADYTLGGLRPFPVAVTTNAGGRLNGLMSLSAGSAGIIREAPRVTISLTKYNLTHDMVLESGVFAMHLLCNDDDVIEQSLRILMMLGGSSGRDGDKIASLRSRPGTSGVPVLLDALSYVEAQVCGTLDNDENTIFVGDVIASECLRPEGGRLHINEAWGKLPRHWIEQYERNHVAQLEDARRRRGLIV